MCSLSRRSGTPQYRCQRGLPCIERPTRSGMDKVPYPAPQSWAPSAALRVSDFAQTAAVQAGIVLPRGAWDRGLALRHPSPRRPQPSLAPFATVVPRLPIVAGAQTTADKPSCAGDTRTEGNCISVKLRKPRMVWVANHRPAIAAVALGRSAAPTTGSIDAALLADRTGSQGDPASETAVAAASSTEPQSAVATPKNKKAQKSARSQNHRRDPYRYGAPSWREVRVDHWAARGYAPRERD
jgi:hypothetical protein